MVDTSVVFPKPGQTAFLWGNWDSTWLSLTSNEICPCSLWCSGHDISKWCFYVSKIVTIFSLIQFTLFLFEAPDLSSGTKLKCSELWASGYLRFECTSLRNFLLSSQDGSQVPGWCSTTTWWHQASKLWSRDLRWYLLRSTGLHVFSCGHSSSLASGEVSVCPLVLWVSSVPHEKIFGFSPGRAVVAGSNCKSARLIQAYCTLCGGDSGLMDQIPSLLSKPCLSVLWYSLHLTGIGSIMIITLAG